MDVEEIKKGAAPILRRFRIGKAAVFGSVARGTATPNSDVDLLVEMPRPYSLFDFLTMKGELEDVLGRKVDLIEYANLKPRIRDNALQSAVAII